MPRPPTVTQAAALGRLLSEALERCVQELAGAQAALAEEPRSNRLLADKLSAKMQELADAVRGWAYQTFSHAWHGSTTAAGKRGTKAFRGAGAAGTGLGVGAPARRRDSTSLVQQRDQSEPCRSRPALRLWPAPMTLESSTAEASICEF